MLPAERTARAASQQLRQPLHWFQGSQWTALEIVGKLMTVVGRHYDGVLALGASNTDGRRR